MRRFTPWFLAAILSCAVARAWDYEIHRVVNQLALASLPTNFPAFARTAAAEERLAFLGGEPDRWRNSPDPPLRHANGPDHFLDVEELEPYGLELETLEPFRYEFVARMAQARAAHAERFPTTPAARDPDRTRQLPGFLPWTITEWQAKLKSAFSYLKAYESNGTPEEIINAQENVLYLMGTLGHFAGDAAQPLHTTRHYNGWVGANPKAYTTNRSFHAWIDGGYLLKVGVDFAGLNARLRPAQAVCPADAKGAQPGVFPEMLRFLRRQHALVEPLYQLEKEGRLSGQGELGRSGLAVLEAQLLAGAQLLGDLWYSAWHEAPPDKFLVDWLAKRKAAASKPKATQ